MKALASVLEVDVSVLQFPEHGAQPEPTAAAAASPLNDSTTTLAEEATIRQVRDRKSFYSHLIWYVVTILLLLGFNVFGSMPYATTGWIALGWGSGVLLHGLNALGVFAAFVAFWKRELIAKRFNKRA